MASAWLFFFSATQGRRPAVIRKLVRNQATSSTLFWAMIYGLLDWQNTIPHLDEQQFTAALRRDQHQGLVRVQDDELFLTPKGNRKRQEVVAHRLALTTPELFRQVAVADWTQMVRFLVQVASEASYHNVKYVVATDRLQFKVTLKQWLRAGHSLGELRDVLQLSLAAVLKTFPTNQADCYAQGLVGHGYYGHTIAQRATTQLTVQDVQVNDQNVALALWQRWQKWPAGAALMTPFRRPELAPSLVTTGRMITSGMSLATIARRRHLKMSTVADHAVMLALYQPDFPVMQLLSAARSAQLDQLAPADYVHWAYRDVVAADETITFPEFRLYQIRRWRREHE
ncbi:helix-turn-helix domain-containing protein [Ligilactobacillus sp. LYQ139]|uniref:helix-turn-helix domain-containing protein n=1 Tax=Ligilactobacillus sp. LYQ139 TaxID=3378800 RepID=UPI003851C6A0